MLIKAVANYRSGFMVSSRKLKKAYIANTAIPFAIVENFYSDSFLEKIVENFAVIVTNAKNYYRNSHEVDILLRTEKKIIPIEVKYGEPETCSTLKFLSDFNLKKAIILAKDIFDKRTINGKSLLLVPVWAFSLTIDAVLDEIK